MSALQKLSSSTYVCQLLLGFWVCFSPLFYPAVAFSDSNFEFSNDLFTGGSNKDRYLSNRFGYAGKLSSKETLGIWSDMYTPDNLRTPTPEEGDHPYGGYTYLAYTIESDKVFTGDLTEYRTHEFRSGLLGNASGAGSIQKFVHDDLDMGVHPEGWDSQAASEAAIEFIYSHHIEYPIQSQIGDTTGKQTYGVRIGNVVDEVFFDQEVSKKFFKYFKVLSGIHAEIKFFDTNLEGRMFRSNQGVYTVERELLVATARAGVEIDVYGSAVGFVTSYQTPTFEEQTENHWYGSFYIRGDF